MASRASWRRLLDREVNESLKRAQPAFSNPMLATLTHEPFSDPDWIYERKFDGERCLTVKSRGRVELFSRNEKSLNDTYPELERAIGEIEADGLVADGEVVAFSGNTTSFRRLQGRMQIRDRGEAEASSVKVWFYLFDLLVLDSMDLTSLPLERRKAILKRAVDFSDPLRFTPHRNEQGEAYFREACQKGWEGLIAKRRGSAYVRARSRDWLKFKCSARQEFVIGGWTDPKGGRAELGALLIGYYDGGELVYAGKVGTGFDEAALQDLSSRLGGLERKKNPFDRGRDMPREAHWAEPSLVGEVAFTEWTDSGKLRHPSFLGLRRDKDPVEVVREEAP